MIDQQMLPLQPDNFRILLDFLATAIDLRMQHFRKGTGFQDIIQNFRADLAAAACAVGILGEAYRVRFFHVEMLDFFPQSNSPAGRF